MLTIKKITFVIILLAALLLAGCSAKLNNNGAETTPEESVWSSLPNEVGFEDTLRDILSEMSNTDIEIEDYKCENGHISCNYLNGQVYFMGGVIDGKVTTSFAYTSFDTFNTYKGAAGQSFLGLVIAPLALYNSDCTDGKTLFSFVDSVAESRDDENVPTGILEQNGIEYTFSSMYVLSCQARYVEDMSIYDEDDTLIPSESTLPERDSYDAQNDMSANAPDDNISSRESWTYKGKSGVISPCYYDEFGTEIGNYYSLSVPAFWNEKYDMEVIPNGYGYNVSFYCSSEKEAGYGGLLFSVLMLDPEDDYTIYPSYDLIGEIGAYRIGSYNLVIYYPSDVQWQTPESDYAAMCSSIDDIVASIKFGDEITFTKANSN